MSTPIRILLVEDQYFFRLALRTTMESRADMRIVAETDRGAEAVELCRRHTPDVAIVDLRLPGMSGFEVLEAVRRDAPTVRTLVLSNYEGSEHVRRAVEAGALAYLTKDASSEELLGAVLSVSQGQRYATKPVTALLSERVPGAELTERELDVLRALARGKSNREIALDLGIAENTVRIHMGRILSKLGVADRTQAALAAVQRGLAQVD